VATSLAGAAVFTSEAPLILSAAIAQGASRTSTPALLPGEVDISTAGYMNDPRNQGACNSCTAHAVVATIEATINVKNGFNQPTTRKQFSVAQLSFCPGAPYQCNTTHWWPYEALLYCKTVGLVDEPVWKYPSTALKQYPNVNWCEVKVADLASAQKITGFTRLASAAEIKAQLDLTTGGTPSGGPVIAVMLEYQDLFSWNQGNTMYEPVPSKTNKVVGGHVVSIVGYKGNDYWICQNSWGSSWNGTGYFRVKQNGATLIDAIDMWKVTI
jgi:hypothetical protein